MKLLLLIFKNCIQYGIFRNLWKKSNIVPIHKKGCKQCIVNLCPVSFLPICSKIFERVIFDPVFELLELPVIKVSKWAYQWKMCFSLDITKEAQEVTFSLKSKKTDHLIVYFNDAPVGH